MNNEDRIRRAIKELSGVKNLQTEGIICTVKAGSYDAAALTITCEPLDGTSDLTGIKIAPDASVNNYVLPVPSDNSVVIVQLTSQADGYVALFSAVDSVQFLDGSYGGLIKINDLLTKLNNIENKINTIMNALTGSAVLAGDGGATYKANITAAIGANLTTTVLADIENNLITHGIQ